MAFLIGLTGPPGSGKGAVARILAGVAERHGVRTEYFSLSREIRREVEMEGIPVQRDALKNTADLFRARMGNGVWALLVASRIEEYLAALDNTNVVVVIDGIRNPGEVRELRMRFGNRFRLLGVVAPPEAIMRNLQRRRRQDEPENVLEDEEALQTLIESEMGSGEPGFGHHIAACVAMSDWPPIRNDGSLTELEEKVRALVELHVLPALQDSDSLVAPDDRKPAPRA